MEAAENNGDVEGDMVLVCHSSGKSWVIKNAFWEKDWEMQASAHISDPSHKFMYDRSRALTLAHNIQNRLDTEFGVWELFFKKGDSKKNNGVSLDSQKTEGVH